MPMMKKVLDVAHKSAVLLCVGTSAYLAANTFGLMYSIRQFRIKSEEERLAREKDEAIKQATSTSSSN
eukprot:CAMPEP_0167776270 /NCGR_PEP_ID=MMETSP0111_2-20121227/3029_1 /TAXON_ID=91324 /ORGANISM="Lotharella globosa, Strain CCCM811" /LENGTH=67 /DNA_ID=CAMNT_0007666293 /DNA_START=57 /DNA_END=260 /DNA_ORIENTATION=-